MNVATLLAYRIILGKLKFSEVPASLQPQVKQILTESGVPELAVIGTEE